jgi:hypothetical protein
VEVMPPNTNRATALLAVPGPIILVRDRYRAGQTCADAVMQACTALARRTSEPIVRITDVLAELGTTHGDYAPDTIYKTIRQLTVDDAANRYPTGLQRLDRHQLFVVP